MASPKEICALIADVGGTNTRLGLITFKEEDIKPTNIKFTVYKSHDYPSLEACIADFLCEYKGSSYWPQSATLAIAGAPMDNKLKMINANHWPEIDGDSLGRVFDIPSFKLINDSESIGYSLVNLREEELITVHNATRLEGGYRAVAGAGTGLGECVLHSVKLKDGKFLYGVCPTEGGHKDFSPTEEIEWEFRKFSIENIPAIQAMGHFPTEKAFCGLAIPHIYKFLARKEGAEEKELSPKEIFPLALKNEDPIAKKTLEWYAKMYGKEISNFALDCLPYGGIYLVGSMVNSVADYFVNDPKCPFMQGYLSKDKVSNETLKRFPIYIVNNLDLGIIGAFTKAKMDIF